MDKNTPLFSKNSTIFPNNCSTKICMERWFFLMVGFQQYASVSRPRILIYLVHKAFVLLWHHKDRNQQSNNHTSFYFRLSYNLQNLIPDALSSSIRYRLFTSTSTFSESGTSGLKSSFSCIIDIERYSLWPTATITQSALGI